VKKTYLHYIKSKNENKDNIKITQIPKVDKKIVVDINILLNRVRNKKKNESKKNFFFFSFVTLAVGLFGIFVVNIG